VTPGAWIRRHLTAGRGAAWPQRGEALVSGDDETLVMEADEKDELAPPLVQSQQSLLYTEARRLLEFKRQHITSQNQTPCP